MASRLKARKPGRGRATTARSRRNDPRGGARTSVAARPSSRMNPRAASSRSGRVATRPRTEAVRPLGKRDLKELRRLLEEERRRLTEELEAMQEHQPELEHQVGLDLTGSYDEDFADVAGDTFRTSPTWCSSSGWC